MKARAILGAATAAICALAAAGAASPGAAALWRVGFVAALASKLADTCQSEVGKAYGPGLGSAKF